MPTRRSRCRCSRRTRWRATRRASSSACTTAAAISWRASSAATSRAAAPRKPSRGASTRPAARCRVARRAPSPLHQLRQPLVSRATYGQFGAALEHGDAAVLAERLDAREALHVQQERAVDAHEAFGIEQALELAKRLLLEVL